MVEFGPAGRCELMEELKLDFVDVPKYLSERGLTTFEYPLTYGVNISLERAKEIGEAFAKYGISLSAHAPYYINLATPDDLNADKSFGYIIASIKIMKAMGANRLVFHPGSLTKQERLVAVDNCKRRLAELIEILKEQNLLDGIYICPETMGKHGQIGTVDEVIDFCKIDVHIMPTIDFGHVNAYTIGGLKTETDFDEIFNKLIAGLGERGKNIHCHFSRIVYTDKGEKNHLNFDSEEEFGPDYKMLLKSLKKNNINARIVCESHGHQTQDSITMLNEYRN